MTVIMALKRNGEVWLGSDAIITDGDYKLNYSHSDSNSKLVFLDHAVIGASGDLTIRNYLELFISKAKTKSFPFRGKLDVIEFFIAFKKFLKKEGGLGDSDANQVQGMQDTGWLVATHDQIYTVDHDGAILEHPVMCVIGSGTYSARAALEYMLEYQPNLPIIKMLKRAHKITVKHNITCGGQQRQINVTKLLGDVIFEK